jgi:hypothetical protein
MTMPGRHILVLQVIDGYDIGARNTSLALAYLSSYEHMGIMEVTCIEGCACASHRIDGHHTRPESQTTLHVIEVTRAPACKLRFNVLGETKSGEYKVKLIGVIVSAVKGEHFMPTVWEGPIGRKR